MRCPFCQHEGSQVKDSRPTEDGSVIRRRRQCMDCGARFTTFERVQLRELTVLKKGGKREPFNRDKLARSMLVACRKRPVEPEHIEKAISRVQRHLESLGESEVTADTIGQSVMEELAELDPVAYVRFASVYKEFREVEDFEAFVGSLASKASPRKPLS